MNTKPLLFSLATTFFSLPINAADIELIGAGSNLSDDAIATEYNFITPINMTDTMCIGINDSTTGNYHITASQSLGSFHLERDITKQKLPYSLAFSDNTAAMNGNALSYNTPLQLSSSLSKQDCDDGKQNAKIFISVAPKDLSTAIAGTYRATVNLTVTAL
jgi:hypothetical protein